MAENKRKTSHRPNRQQNRSQSKSQVLAAPTKTSKNNTINQRDGQNKSKTVPRLPSRLRKQVDSMNPHVADSDEEIDSDFEANDVYEYEEGVPEEESRKNKRFDMVDNFEYELPQDFKDENVPSDEDVEGSDDNGDDGEAEEEDNGRHGRMLQGITGLPIEAFDEKKKKNDAVVSEAYPESEYNPSRDVLEGDSHISIQDLLGPLDGTPGFSKLRRRTQEWGRKSNSVLAPLSKPDREMAERVATYEHSKKDISKWEPVIKKNREASTISFNGDVNLGVSTVGAIASEFKPRTDFEKKMEAIVHDQRVVEAHAKDGAKLLEMNEISEEEVKRGRDHQAKLRSLLFRHEIKAKKRKKIKSKTYHRLLKKDRLKSASGEMHLDPEAAKEYAKKQEFKRAEERLTLKHKNNSKWAKRNIERGLSAQDEGTRAAMAAQLHEHARLTRKMHSMKDSSSSSDDSDDEDDDEEASASEIIEEAKAKMQKMFGKEDEVRTGLFSLPFMVRREEAAQKTALEEYDLHMKQLKDDNGPDKKVSTILSGRRTFGPTKKEAPKSDIRKNPEIDYGSSGEEEDFMDKEHAGIINQESKGSQKDVDIDANLFREETEIDHDHLFKSFNEIVANPGPKTTYEVAILAPDASKKIKNRSRGDRNTKSSLKTIQNAPPNPVLEKGGEDSSDSDGEGQMLDGILTATTQPAYELPSYTELIRRAFAGDDVEDDFDKDKQEILNEENPEPEKPSELPGWGQWTEIQSKRGLPPWMVREHDDAKKKRAEALKLRKDAKLKNVIISEKFDKKADKLHTKTLPFPHTSNDVYEQSIRMPIGPDFNPASAIADLNRPAVVKRTGLKIAPIKFEDVNPHERTEDHKRKPGNGNQKNKKRKSNGGITQKKGTKKVKAGH